MKTSTSKIQRSLHAWKSAAWVALFLIMAGASAVQGQTIQSVNPTTTTAGQNITMIITGSNTNFVPVTGMFLRSNVQLGTIYQSSNFNAVSATSATADFSIPPNAPLGFYSIETIGGLFMGNALNVGVGPGSAYGLVSGKVIYDNNSNCIEDGGDAPVGSAIVTLSPGPLFLTAGPNGDYSGWVPNGTYTLSTNVLGCGSYVCPAGGTLTASVLTSLSTSVGNDFYWHSIPACSDLQSFCGSGIMRPGFDVTTYAGFWNNGPNAVTNAVGTLILDSILTYLSASVPPSQINGDTLRWNIGSMASQSSFNVSVLVNVPAVTPLGTPIHLKSSLPAIGVDPNLSNNTMPITVVVQGSYDPNDKQVWDLNGAIADGPIDPSTTTLNYLVRFQNTGTDTAFNIFVRDTLDLNLDAGSLKVTSASHPYVMTLNGANHLQFTFPNILLVDSFHNEPASHGYIGYTVDLNPGLPLGTSIDNSASIYFDFNQPVLTNTTQSVLCALLDEDFSFTHTGLAYAFTDLSDASATAWSWDFGDGSTSTLQNPTHSYAAAGNYTVCLTVSNACRTATVCYSLLLTGVDGGKGITSLHIAPNPSTGIFRVMAELPTRGDLTWQVIDSKGLVVYAHSGSQSAGAFAEVIDLSNQPSGMYLLRLVHQGRTMAMKLVKE